MNQYQPVRALVFDAYGTLFDVHSVVALCDQLFPGRGPDLSQGWRTRQLDYTWLRSLMGRYENFWQVTEDALAFACEALQLDCSAAARARLMDEYLRLKPFPEVPEALTALSQYSPAILSNGSPRMLEAVVENAGLASVISHTISVDEVKTYKPSPRVYELAPAKLGVEKDAIGFVSSNCWDVIGAKSFGFRTFWVNRSSLPAEKLTFRPDATLKSLTELLPNLVQAGLSEHAR